MRHFTNTNKMLKLSWQFLYQSEGAAGLVAVGHISHQILVGSILKRSSTWPAFEPPALLCSFIVTDIRDTAALRILEIFMNLGQIFSWKLLILRIKQHYLSFVAVFNYQKPQENNAYFTDTIEGMQCDCMPDCSFSKYSTATSMSPLV
jgi:hypothetical protein